jgi:hypothetical protein
VKVKIPRNWWFMPLKTVWLNCNSQICNLNIKVRVKFIQLLKPGTTRRNLLLIAAFVWTFAGAMLLSRGILMMGSDHDFLIFRMVISLLGGVLFYTVLFSKISKKHVARIIGLTNDRPCVFSFFNVKSYLMMGFMISFGVFLRTSGVVSPFYLSVLYITMGIPLFASAFRFYYSGFCYHL